MRFFSYRAIDSRGSTAEGTIQAASADDARRLLTGGGLKVVGLHEVGGAAPRPAATPAPRGAPAPGTAPSVRPQTNRPVSTPVVSAAAQAPVKQTVRTLMGTDKERFFLFSQLAAAYRAGITPYQALQEISRRTAQKYQPALIYAADRVRDGGSLADALEPYVDLFPDHAIGCVRAGETGGFVPEALEEVSRQAEEAHKFKRWFFWIWFLAVNALLSIPGMWMTTRGMLRGWEIIDAKGGETNGPAFKEVFTGFYQSFTGIWGWLTLAFFIEVALLYWYLRSRRTRPFRHRMGMLIPTFGRRAKHEGFARFSWAMSRVSRGGTPPARAWQLAVETVPNMTLREPLLDISRRLHGNEKLSDIVASARLFPDEYVPIIATAEYTGDIPGALDNLSRASGGEFFAAQNYAKARGGCWGLLGCFMTSAAMLGILWYAWYWELPKKVLDGLETLMPMIHR